jgi:hypothetical protein
MIILKPIAGGVIFLRFCGVLKPLPTVLIGALRIVVG